MFLKSKYKSRRLYANLIIGVIWILLGGLNLLDTDHVKWYDYAYLIIGILYLLLFFYDLSHPYISIENGILKKSTLYGLGVKIKLKNIITIKRTTDNYIVNTDKKKMTINTKVIDEESTIMLENILSELQIQIHKPQH
ncbi:hypothetical protein ACW5R3_08840 [Bizionia sp. KMM 8389]